ncbi:MAG TPA: cardiolipin synthase [Erysipelothrix sp.]
MKKLLKLISNKIFIIALAVILEFSLLFVLWYKVTSKYALIHGILQVLSFLLLLHVIDRHDNPYYRFAWAIIILTIPPFGAILYIMFGEKKVPKALRKTVGEAYPEIEYLQSNDVLKKLPDRYKNWERLVDYIYGASHFPLYEHTYSEYLESGEIKFSRLLEELEKAEKFIFFEYFIIKDGHMWQEIYKVLKRKAQAGIDVRVVFDDWGCALFPQLKKQCEEAGMRVVVFNPLVPRLAIQMNNRDHRKIAVVDGRVGFVGGINIGDEYINLKSRFGHWKDTAVLIEGEAVFSLTLMFLQIFNYYDDNHDNPNDYKYEFKDMQDYTGYVLPFDDAPTDDYDVGADAHLTMINNAKRYIYIQTPYLIVGHEMIKALQLAAESGVDVRIILPHIPDKKIVNMVTKSSYDELISSGVKIYEYKPGFVHSKTIVVDDEICLVGTTNMDFRSYYLHFETGILFVGTPVVQSCYEDVMKTIDVSIEITQEMARDISYPTRILRSFLKIFSGLM